MQPFAAALAPFARAKSGQRAFRMPCRLVGIRHICNSRVFLKRSVPRRAECAASGAQSTAPAAGPVWQRILETSDSMCTYQGQRVVVSLESR